MRIFNMPHGIFSDYCRFSNVQDPNFESVDDYCNPGKNYDFKFIWKIIFSVTYKAKNTR